MGIKERQERDREAVRRAILDAARELFVAEGYQNVSIRKVAERIEYSPAAIYGYFASKDDLFFALAEEGFRLLSTPVGFSQNDTLDPIERIRAIFWRFYEFSREHPQYFWLMFVDRSVPRICREYERSPFVRQLRQDIIAQVQRAIDAKSLPPSADASVAFLLLATGITGVALMRLSDRGPTAIADELARDIINVLIAGLQAGVHLELAGPVWPHELAHAD
jgi:AcrR family transcriptional regulator